MTWFKVDDGLHSHLKAQRAIRDSPSSMSLWVLAGSWCADQLTDGWLPEYQAARLTPKTWKADARALVKSGLWITQERDGEAGWQFHQWDEPGRQPSREQVLLDRAAAAERQKAFRERVRDRKRVTNADSHAASNGVTNRGSNGPPDPTRPPLKGGGVKGAPAAPGGARPDQCRKHRGQLAHNCAICRSEQLAAKDTP